jgi:hypothetical protein
MSYRAPQLLRFGNVLRVTLGGDNAGPDGINSLLG